MRLVLASTSPYRRALLERLRIPFQARSPGIDETPLAGEAPAVLAKRLAQAKAEAVAAAPELAGAWVIGSDQVADLDGSALGKPLTRARCIEQLLACSGRRVRFHTGLALALAGSDRVQTCVEPFDVRFRKLTHAEVVQYVDIESPLDAAGGFYSEGLGITLFDALEGRDPNALVGLPLIALREQLAAADINLLALAGSA